MNKDSFILHDDQYECFSLLSMEERGLLITAIFEYRLHGKTTQNLSQAAYMAYHLITCQLKRDAEKYRGVCEKRRASIESRYKSIQMNTNVAKDGKNKQKKTNVNHTETDTDTDTDTDTESLLSSNESNKDINSKKETNKEKSSLEKRFDEFWEAYPKKVGKAYAKACFMKLKPTEELTKQMIKAIEVQKHSADWKRDGGQYIPNPSTWLNQGRWEDELKRDPNDHYMTEEEERAYLERSDRELEAMFGKDWNNGDC